MLCSYILYMMMFYGVFFLPCLRNIQMMFYDIFSDFRLIYTMFSNLFSDVTTSLTDNGDLAVIDSSMIVLHHPLSSPKHDSFQEVSISFSKRHLAHSPTTETTRKANVTDLLDSGDGSVCL